MTARSVGQFYKVDGNSLWRAYKNHLSNFHDWVQREHADKWVLLPQNMGKSLSIDETMLCKDLFTFLTNKDGHGRRGSLIAAVKGTTSAEVVRRLMELPEADRRAVEEVTMDFSYSMFSIVSQVFPNATIVIDCFHVMMRLGEALEEMRMKMKRQAQKEQKKEERLHRKKCQMRMKARLRYRKNHPRKRGEKRGRPRKKRKNEKFVPAKLANGETKVDLLTHVRYPLLKSMNEWTGRQKERMCILYDLNPKMQTAYLLVNRFRNIMKKKQTKEEAKEELHEWYKDVGKSLIRELIAARDTIKSREDHVLNYFINRSTNAAAESINSKIKGFRFQMRGIADLPFFMYRLCKVFG